MHGLIKLLLIELHTIDKPTLQEVLILTQVALAVLVLLEHRIATALLLVQVIHLDQVEVLAQVQVALILQEAQVQDLALVQVAPILQEAAQVLLRVEVILLQEAVDQAVAREAAVDHQDLHHQVDHHQEAEDNSTLC